MTVQELIDDLNKVTDKSLPVLSRLKLKGNEEFYFAFPIDLAYLSSNPRQSNLQQTIFGVYLESQLTKASPRQTSNHQPYQGPIAPGGAAFMGKGS